MNDKPPEWLVELKAKVERGDRPRDKAHGRWLGDFLDQDTPSGLLPIEKRLLDASAGGYVIRKFDLRLMSSLNDVSGIPTEGNNLIIVAAVNNVLHFRIFDDDGKMVVDTDEKRLTEQAQQIEDLRKQLESLWPPHELTRSENCRVITAVTSIVSHPRIRARFLRFLALGGDESAPVHESGVELHDAFIDGELDLRGTKCVGRLALVCCHVQGPLMIEDASLGILYLEGSRVHGIKGNRARITGSVFLNNGFVSEGVIGLFGAEIGGSLQCGGAKIYRMKEEREQDTLICTASKISGNVLLNDEFETNGCVWLNNAIIGGSLRCGGAKIYCMKEEREQDTLICTASKISGNVFLNDEFETNGCVWLNNAIIGGGLDCRKGKFSNAHGTALNCDVATIASVKLDDVKIHGNVSFVDARVGAGFYCTRVEVTGQVSLYGADIGLDLECSGGHIINAKGDALVLTSAQIKGTVFLDQRWDGRTKFAGERFEAEGGVNLYGADIGSDLICSGGHIINAKGDALVLTSAQIKGTVALDQRWDDRTKFAGERFEAEGGVNLYGADIGRDLICSGGHIINAKGDALVLTSAQIKGRGVLGSKMGRSYKVRW